MQIGQILVGQRWVEPAALARALAEQRHTGKRICSLLIARGLLDPDNAARALANQHTVAGVLQKHLEHRDRSLAALLDPALARSHVALPIGRARNQELIVCVRDPRPELAQLLATAVGGPVLIAVAPAHQLEQLVKEVYEAMPSRAGDDAVDVDLTTRPIAILRDLRDFDVDLSTRAIPVIGDPLDHLESMTLVGLDDVRVAKDPSQSGKLAAVLPRTQTSPGHARTAPPPARTPPPRPGTGPTLDATLAVIERAAAIDDATDAAMAFLAERFHRAVWFGIHEGAALGERGHGASLTPEVIQAITVPLSAPSTVQAAHDTRRLATAAPAGAGTIQDRLLRTLGSPRAHAAIPVEVDARVAYVLAVGDAIGDPATASPELEQLGRALGVAYGRIAPADA